MRTSFGARGVAVAALALAVGLAACSSDDDGATVRSLGCASGSASGSGSGSAPASGSGSASGSASACASGSGSASASGSGLSSSDIGSGSGESAAVKEAVEQYRAYVAEQVTDTVTRTKVFTDAVRAGDLEAAKAAYAPSRVGWESIEPIAALVEDIDGAVDARVDDFEGPTDPTWTGWHRLEYLLFDQNTTEGGAAFADKLDADLQELQTQLPDLEITGLAVARGSGELIEEVSEGKITGEEDRYAGTDLWDFAANVAGAHKAFELLTPALEEADPDLVTQIEDEFAAVEAVLATYQTPDGGYQPYSALTEADTTQLKSDLGALSESLASVPGALGLR
jgi:iron uptake system component EfeO